ncbi:MAG: prolipoprotein diacylglyceryl transferase [Candidatus Gastranaerophilaceae bacterium]|jgi:phosphatidylglycerol:prolipoprotein diacylglycerol transferase
MFTSPGAVAFQFGSLTIYWYGIMIATAFLTGLFVTLKIARKYYNSSEIEDNIYNLAFIILPGALIGARLYFVLFNLDYYLQNPLDIIMIHKGGLSIHGGILGGFLTGICYTLKNKIPAFMYADLFAFGVIIGQAIGRWGNFFNSEAFAKPTNLPWKLYISPLMRPEKYANEAFFHPAFLYESLWNIFVFFILYFFIWKKYSNKHGIVFFSYLILYSIGRLFIESIRIDSVFNFLGFPVAQWMSIILIITGIIGIIIINFCHCKER